MKKSLLSIACALVILSACQKTEVKPLTAKPISTVAIPDSTKVTSSATSKPVVNASASDMHIGTPSVAMPSVTASPTTSVTTRVVMPPATVSTQTGMSFSKDIVPMLSQCNSCHMHGWMASPVTSTMYSNMLSQKYIMPSNYTSSLIYMKLMSGHTGMMSTYSNTGYGMMPTYSSKGSGMMSSGNNSAYAMMTSTNLDKFMAWMQQGSLNN